jgi:MHS family proline/betaine transporter-like MFS transporter
VIRNALSPESRPARILPGAGSGPHAGILAAQARLTQGFVLGSEYGSATALMIEHSPNGEARAASWQRVSQNIAGLSASGIAWPQQPSRVQERYPSHRA